MAQLLVRNLSADTVALLKRRAAEHGRSVEAEHRAILEQTLHAEHRARMEAWWKESEPLRQRLKDRTLGDSTALIREDRDRR